LPDEVVAEIAERAAALVLDELHAKSEEPVSPYLKVWASAASYLGMSPSTLKHLPGVPRRRIGGSVVFRRDELDAFADAYFEGLSRFRRGSISVPSEHRANGRGFLGAKKSRGFLGAKKSPA
jgi:hypothetical protein